jgi:hypothetical protein
LFALTEELALAKYFMPAKGFEETSERIGGHWDIGVMITQR